MSYFYLTKKDKLNYLNYLITMTKSRIETGISDTIGQDQLNTDLITLPLLIQEKEKIENE